MRDALRDRSVAVIGGGPGGLMVAEILGEAGVPVTVYEHRASVGRKFLLAGRGGLNITHSEPIDTFLDRYGAARPALEPAIRAFDPASLRAWCAGLGQDTFVGTSGRVFPAAFRATPLLRAWLGRLAGLGVEFRLGHRWTGWADDGAVIFTDRAGTSIRTGPAATVLALGGASWPRVGADGGWVPLLTGRGIAVAPLRPANCGFAVDWSPVFGDRFAGTPLKNVALSFGGATARGDAMITDAGIEGGAVYALSASLRDALDDAPDGGVGEVVLRVDLCPDVPVAALADRLAHRRPKDSWSTGLRRAAHLAPVAIGLLREGRAASSGGAPIAAMAPAELAAAIKAVPVRLRAPQPLARSISTAGGVALGEIDDRFMLRRLPGTFVVGEMLDWEAPTGGYLLQATFATAVAAARGALVHLDA